MLKRVIALMLLIPSVFFTQNQHTIKGTFSPAKDYNVALLYKVTPSLFEYISKADVKADGTFEFKLDATATKGIYRLVYAVPQEDYSFDIIYNNQEDIELTFNSETGVKFIKSKENNLIKSYTNSMSLVTKNIGDFYRQKSKDTTALRAIFKTQEETQQRYEKEAKGSIVLDFIKANRPYIPKKYETVKTYTNNIKAHYFDYIDFNNKTLQSSSFLEERMLNYVFGISDDKQKEEANYKKNTDVFCKVIKDVSIEVKRILLVDLWEQMKDSGYETVANYISETYLMDIAVELNDQELLNELLILINTSKGGLAPDFSFEIEKNQKKVTKQFYDLNTAEKYIVLFWSSSCSHCLEEIPQLHSYIKGQAKGAISVIAIGLEEDPKEWNTLSKKYTEFIHVYGKEKWNNPIGRIYGVKAIPTYFVLDKDKKIIDKPEDFESLKDFFEGK